MSGDKTFDVSNDADFYRWATPIILYLIKHGEVMPPSQSQLHREVFRKVLERMWTTPFPRLLSAVSDFSSECKLQIASFQASAETRTVIDNISSSWPEPLTQVLETGDWYPERGLGSGSNSTGSNAQNASGS